MKEIYYRNRQLSNDFYCKNILSIWHCAAKKIKAFDKKYDWGNGINGIYEAGKTMIIVEV